MSDGMDWATDGACRGATNVNFFPPRASMAAPVPPVIQEMCEGCPVRAECLDWAVRHEPLGFWAATNPDQRRLYRIRHKIPWDPIRFDIELDAFIKRLRNPQPDPEDEGE